VSDRPESPSMNSHDREVVDAKTKRGSLILKPRLTGVY
jgi:hypothetical protein